jgi:hypothetical protein
MNAEIKSLAGLAFVLEGRVGDGLRTYGEALRDRPSLALQRRTMAMLYRAADSLAR